MADMVKSVNTWVSLIDSTERRLLDRHDIAFSGQVN